MHVVASPSVSGINSLHISETQILFPELSAVMSLLAQSRDALEERNGAIDRQCMRGDYR